MRAVALVAVELLRAQSTEQAIPRALAAIGAATGVDRILVLQNGVGADRKPLNLLRYVWHGAGAKSLLSPGPVPSVGGQPLELTGLGKGEPVATVRGDASQPMRTFMDQINVRSFVLTPILIDGRHWGQISFDDLTEERVWSAGEVAILQNLAELIAAALRRELTLADLRAHDDLLAAVTRIAATLLTGGTTAETIPEAFAILHGVMDLDRIQVLEAGERGERCVYLRFGWYASPSYQTIQIGEGMPLAGSPPELVRLRHEPVSARRSKASPIMQAFLDQLGIQSLLITPILVGGRVWGSITFDDCRAERRWSASEIAVLQNLAELIGASITRERFLRELTDANTIIQNSPTVLYRLKGEPSFPMTYVSQNISLFGQEPAELIAAPNLYLALIHPDDQSAVNASMAQLLDPDEKAFSIEFRFRAVDGHYRWIECRGAPVRDAAGRLIEVEGVMTDVTERKAADEKIARLARTDPLTGLANRATFADHLRLAFGNARRGASSFAVLYLDLDRFKDVNDTFGHPAGDLLIKSAANRLRDCVRDTDVVARLGGDEFAVLQSNLNELSAAGVLAEKIRLALTEPYVIDGNVLRVSASIGIAPYSPEAESPDAMLAQADLALYRAKDDGRGRYRFHSEDLDHSVHERFSLAEDFRRALGSDELELFYEPQVELASGHLASMQVSPRWNHPERGTLEAEQFVPIAEKSGLILAYGQWVLDGACRQMSEWRAMNAAPPLIALSASLHELRSGDEFVQRVTETLARWAVAPEELELGISESTLAHMTLAQNKVLDELGKLGVRIAILGFGSKYSSLDYLKTYNISRLKIGAAMVAAGTQRAGDSSMMRAIISVARELGIDVVADGVERADQRRLLLQHGGSIEGQGHWLGDAMSGADSLDMLRGHWRKSAMAS